MMDAKMIAKLEEMGGKRWTKGSMDRMYFNARDLGLELKYYETGNVKDAKFRGAQLSNSDGRRYKAAKTYVDLATGEVHSDYDDLADVAREMIAKAEQELTDGDAKTKTAEPVITVQELFAAQVADDVMMTIDEMEADFNDTDRKHPAFAAVEERLHRIRACMQDDETVRAAAADVLATYGDVKGDFRARARAMGKAMAMAPTNDTVRRLLGL